MFEEFFENCEMQDSEKMSEELSENIKASLRKKIAADSLQPNNSDKEKGKDIMKSKSIRTIIIAAAVAVVGLGAAVGATGALFSREEAMAEVAGKNKVTPEFADEAAELAGRVKEEMGIDDVHIPAFYEDVEVSELVVTEFHSGDYKGLFDEDLPAIILERIDEDGRGDVSTLIKSDGNGGYLYHGELITDEKLLAAIAEGTEKYGDTFVIMY